ncbi:c-type cytochrome domain-containing protein [Nannocystis bainbridge]|uniref:Cytochrome C Planctomycete-type domain-containing protein n=1 Tax=Nannocystis bainbridge TaxID=2995303 RepID=A0ABT5DSV9_9BACT|nr:c-type cytochrome domain-containing protein [Nannocystis bainbridge]MDC0716154.1 hypothetical protein [Nannocystis bainbridge]
MLLAGCPPWPPEKTPTDSEGAEPTSSSDPTGTPTGESGTGATTDDPTTGAAETGLIEDCAVLREASRDFLKTYCDTCHGVEPGNGGLHNISDLDTMIEQKRIVGGNPDASKLYARVENGEMPPKEAVPASSLEEFGQYISKCVTAPAGDPLVPPKCAPADPIEPHEMVDLIHQDLGQVDGDDRPFMRYYSLVHLRNLGLCPAQLKTYEQALSKALNSLSTTKFIHPPVAVDGSGRTLFRYDLRHYGWSALQYESVVCEVPFAVEYFDGGFMTNANAVKQDTKTKVFVLPGDALLHSTTRPPLYHQLLGIPGTLADLEGKLGIDLAADTAFEAANDQEVTTWAGFKKSNVGFFNRVIQRFLLSAEDYFWISRDFNSNNGFSDIKAHPIDFKAAGGEIIYSLENRLQGYMIVDAAGNRLDKAPTDVVVNVEDGGAPVVNGISCMGCHARGIRVKSDEVLKHVQSNQNLFDAATKEAVKNIYGPADEFSEWQASDKDRFLAAVNECEAPHMVPTSQGDREPIFLIDIAFEQQLELTQVAAELGVPDSQVLQLSNEPQFSDFAELDDDGGTITRDEFAAVFGAAFEALQLGDGNPLSSCSASKPLP